MQYLYLRDSSYRVILKVSKSQAEWTVYWPPSESRIWRIVPKEMKKDTQAYKMIFLHWVRDTYRVVIQHWEIVGSYKQSHFEKRVGWELKAGTAASCLLIAHTASLLLQAPMQCHHSNHHLMVVHFCDELVKHCYLEFQAISLGWENDWRIMHVSELPLGHFL